MTATGPATPAGDIGSPVIAVRDLVFDYPTCRALHDVSFAIEPGSITALVGPNGAGKTTLLRCVAALDTPYSGAIAVDGLDVLEQPREAHGRLGFLQDFFGLYDDLTVRRCLHHHAAAHGMPRAAIAAAIDATAGRLGIADRLGQKAGTLSRGLRQRLAIAQAIIHEPKVLLLDEPASGLDPEARVELSRLLLTLRDEGMTSIVSSHILAELEDYSSHMLILRDGRIVRHCPIDGAATPRRRLRVTLSAPAADLEPALRDTPGVDGVALEGAGAVFDFAGDVAAQRDLLRRLVEAGLPVAAFHAEQRSMQDVYMDHLRPAGDDAGEDRR